MDVHFIGRLGADAENKTSQNGNQFTTMRVATDDFNRGETKTLWVNVAIITDKLGNRKMTKGSLVEVFGVEHLSTYQTKNGETAISIDVSADRIEYVRTSNPNSGTTVDVKATTDTGKFENTTKSKTTEQTKVEVSESDDLPF